MTSTALSSPSDVSAVRELAKRLPPGARLLDASCGDGTALALLHASGFSVTGFDRDATQVARAASTLRSIGAPEALATVADLRLARLDREAYSAIIALRALEGIDKDGCRRSLAILFAACAPKGWLLIGFDPAVYDEGDIGSLLLQHGFQPEASGVPSVGERRAYIARRI